MRRREVALLLSGVLAAAPRTAAAQAPTTAEQTPAVEAQLATAVVERMPEGSGETFPAEVGEVYAWMRVTGAEGATRHHVWIHGEDEWSVPLMIGGSPWRTWSSKRIPPEWTGEWRVEIRDDTGNLLEALSFTVG